jgi:hypothetical protein
VKELSGCAIRQGSGSDPVQGPVILELEEGLLYRRRSKSDRDPDFSSNNGDSSEAEQSCSSTNNQSRWSDLDEQRLLAYKKTGSGSLVQDQMNLPKGGLPNYWQRGC